MKNQSEPSELTRNCTGWLWVVTGDSQEEVMIFCDRQTDRQTLHHYIFIIIIISIISNTTIAITIIITTIIYMDREIIIVINHSMLHSKVYLIS